MFYRFLKLRCDSISRSYSFYGLTKSRNLCAGSDEAKMQMVCQTRNCLDAVASATSVLLMNGYFSSVAFVGFEVSNKRMHGDEFAFDVELGQVNKQSKNYDMRAFAKPTLPVLEIASAFVDPKASKKLMPGNEFVSGAELRQPNNEEDNSKRSVAQFGSPGFEAATGLQMP